MPVESVVGPVSCVLLEDSSLETQAACLDLLERLGVMTPLGEVRTDGWFQRIGQDISNFDQVCEVMGRRFLAYTIILGIRIRRITTDPRFPANTTVEFAVGDDQPQTLTMGELRIRIVQSLAHYKNPHPAPSLPLTPAGAAEFIGDYILLLASLFDLSLEQLVMSNLSKDEPRGVIGYISEGGFNFMDLRDFEEFIKQKIRRDLAGGTEEPFQLDLTAVDRARRAYADKDFDDVIATLEMWPGLLSILLRSPVARQLDDMQRAIIGEGLELLGAAFQERDRENWALELFRLGLQFVREGQTAGRLFFRLATLLEKEERFGEMIGLLRRALALGAPRDDVLPILGRCFLRQNHLVAAAGLLEHIAAQSNGSSRVEKDLAEVRERLADASITWDVPHRS